MTESEWPFALHNGTPTKKKSEQVDRVSEDFQFTHEKGNHIQIRALTQMKMEENTNTSTKNGREQVNANAVAGTIIKVPLNINLPNSNSIAVTHSGVDPTSSHVSSLDTELHTPSSSLALPTNSSSSSPVSSTPDPFFKRSTRTTFGKVPSHLKDYIYNSIVLNDVVDYLMSRKLI
ncbi:hypothetical protein H5410_001260 [Solanum commersonii]|uniref:Uncharacterized protein n=1 Tax=Solanum commersonii TaxID=4109 RepID=A0A9J6AZL8_SOLCO|nr:hypothetical protein H5410_001260 [Solanum commersonii]